MHVDFTTSKEMLQLLGVANYLMASQQIHKMEHNLQNGKDIHNFD